MALDPSLYLALTYRCTVPVCYKPICRKVVCAGGNMVAGWSQGAGCLDSYLRMITSRSATTVNGSQLAR